MSCAGMFRIIWTTDMVLPDLSKYWRDAIDWRCVMTGPDTEQHGYCLNCGDYDLLVTSTPAYCAACAATCVERDLVAASHQAKVPVAQHRLLGFRHCIHPKILNGRCLACGKTPKED